MRPSARGVAENAAFFGVAGTLLAAGIYQGLQPITVHLNLLVVGVQVLVMNAAAAALSFTAVTTGAAAIYLYRLHRADRRTVETGPELAVIVPAYQEAATLPRAVSSLLASTYRPLSVVIACQRGDPDTAAVAEELADRHDAVQVVVNEDGPQSKPGNVNAAVARCDAPLLAVVDADSTVHPELFAAAVHRITEQGADVAQARWLGATDGWVEAISHYEHLFTATLARQLYLLIPGMGRALTNGTVMTRDAFDRVGGLTDVLADDYDFNLACYREGLAMTEVLAYPVTREPAHSLRDWLGQRKRWMLSYVQVLARLLRQPFGGVRHLVSIGLTAGTVLGAVFALLLTSKLVLLAVIGAFRFSALPLAVLAGVAGGLHLRDHLAGHLPRPHPAVLAFPLAVPVLGLVTVKSVLEY
ncbi:MAG: glycosyltransferase family 2 protein, partial [Candidatus Nanohaloarchaea archaeon]|nr:glycosyltransferase family 2 protein [Candidatus Nanohaloarchaea archaeon]